MTVSVPSAPAKSYAASAPVSSSEIDTFLGLIALGLKHLVSAGQMLGDMLQSDPDVFAKILGRCHWITEDALWTLKNIGDRKFRPEIFFTRPHVSRRLISFDYATQSAAIDTGIPVVTSLPEKKNPVVAMVRVMDISPVQARLAFGETGLRPVEEQAKLIQKGKIFESRYVDNKVKGAGSSAPLPPARFSSFKLEKPTVAAPPNGTSYGCFRMTIRFGQPSLAKIPQDAGRRHPALQRVKVSSGMLDEPEAVIEFYKP